MLLLGGLFFTACIALDLMEERVKIIEGTGIKYINRTRDEVGSESRSYYYRTYEKLID
ncbi:MAG: hypothetical protein IMY76_04035 [Chloroflexi bacterium]|nr:hypothetical protein [Chloroflexota bacterium]